MATSVSFLRIMVLLFLALTLWLKKKYIFFVLGKSPAQVLFEILSSVCSLRIAPYTLVLFGLLMKSHAELNIGRTFSLTRLWCFLSKLTCTSMEIAAFQLSGFPDKTGFCSYCFTTTTISFCRLLLYILCFCFKLQLNFFKPALWGAFVPVFFSVLSCPNTSIFIY